MAEELVAKFHREISELLADLENSEDAELKELLGDSRSTLESDDSVDLDEDTQAMQ